MRAAPGTSSRTMAERGLRVVAAGAMASRQIPDIPSRTLRDPICGAAANRRGTQRSRRNPFII